MPRHRALSAFGDRHTQVLAKLISQLAASPLHWSKGNHATDGSILTRSFISFGPMLHITDGLAGIDDSGRKHAIVKPGQICINRWQRHN
jgi:hypothetical protein